MAEIKQRRRLEKIQDETTICNKNAENKEKEDWRKYKRNTTDNKNNSVNSENRRTMET